MIYCFLAIFDVQNQQHFVWVHNDFDFRQSFNIRIDTNSHFSFMLISNVERFLLQHQTSTSKFSPLFWYFLWRNIHGCCFWSFFTSLLLWLYYQLHIVIAFYRWHVLSLIWWIAVLPMCYTVHLMFPQSCEIFNTNISVYHQLCNIISFFICTEIYNQK